MSNNNDNNNINRNNIITSVIMIPELNEFSYKEAKRLFLSYKEKGVITGGYFDDKSWSVTDEYANYGLNFDLRYIDCDTFLNTIGITKYEYINYVKTYTIFKFGELAFTTLRDFVGQLKHFIASYDFNKPRFVDDYHYNTCNQISEFFSLIKISDDSIQDNLLRALEDVQDDFRKRAPTHQRTLASFESYFKFNDILSRFWEESTDEDEKLFYFPVYLWWNLSGVLPMRPREFVLTPRNCLKKSGDSWTLTIVKDKLKGRNRKVSYKISTDYERVTYSVPDKFADLINWYLEATKKYSDNELYTLFIADTHYKKWDRCIPYNSRYFTYHNLCTCLRYFFEQIVSERYGYNIVYDKSLHNLTSNDIEYIYLGDTRHLAMINIVMEGAPPMIASMLAGHDNTDMTAFYFSNVAEYAECKARRQYVRMIQGKQTYSISKRYNQPLLAKNYIPLGDNRFCCNPQVAEHDFSYCLNVADDNGYIGGCEKCIYYRNSGTSFKKTEENIRNDLQIQLATLKDIVHEYRMHEKNKEDIEQAVLKLQNAEYSYRRFKMEQILLESTEKEENKGDD